MVRVGTEPSGSYGVAAYFVGGAAVSPTPLATALAFALRGLAVFPVNWPVSQGGRFVCSCMGHARGRPCGSPAKHPYGKLAPNGLLSATLDSDTIIQWFKVAAPTANVGVVTDRLIVIDV